MSIFNCTQHNPTTEQIEMGVVPNSPLDQNVIKQLLTFDEPCTNEEMYRRALFLVNKVKSSGYTKCMIGGAGFFMSTLEKALTAQGIKYLHAFSQRVVVGERVKPDGTIEKINEFKHIGFVPKEENI